MIDIGVNINHSFLLDDIENTLLEMSDAGVKGMICIASDLEESKIIQRLCKDRLNMWNTLGCHPHQAKNWSKSSKSECSELILASRPIAVGETGLDFNRNYSSRDEQIFAFSEQIELAAEHELPLYLHERDAHNEIIKILKQHPELATNSVIHCFTGNRQELENYLDLGLYIGITGWVCDERRGKYLQSSIPHIPLNKLLIETDAPYLLPRNIRPRPKKNHPKYLPWVAMEVARLKDIAVEALIQQTNQNTETIFGIKVPT